MCEWCVLIIQNWLDCVLCLPCVRCIYRKLYRLSMRMIRALKDLYNRLRNGFLCCFWRLPWSTDASRYRYKYSHLRDLNDVELNPTNQRELKNIHSGIVANEKINQLETELKVLQSECYKLQTENSQIKDEKEDALRRLSEVMSSNLRDNNPNIVDLSDEYRPTKLAEMSSELYDNEWTEAFSFLEKELSTRSGGSCGDKIIINILLEIFIDVYGVCKNKQESEWKDVVAIIIGSITWNQISASLSRVAGKEDLKYLKDLRKKYAIDRYREIHSMCLQKLQHSTLIERGFLDNQSLLDYINGCVKLSWFSQLQDPPIEFLFPNFRRSPSDKVSTTTASKKGHFTPSDSKLDQSTIINESGAENEVTKFDKNLYKEYTESGPSIDYVVWPVMLLHENGPILNKGVAQGLKNNQYNFE